MDDRDQSAPGSSSSARKRLRTSHACDICRSRKIRCDGLSPCTSCSVSQTECTYGSEANSRGKSDLILEGVLRVERLLQQMNANVVSYRAPLQKPPCDDSGPISDSQHPSANYARNGQGNLENAVLDAMHTSTTESVLQWPHFDVFPSLRNDYVPIFELEQARSPVKMRPTSIMYPLVSQDEIDSILEAFQDNVNFWYPTLSRQQLDKVGLAAKCLSAGVSEDYTVQSCLAHLTMALGCASQTVAGLARRTSLPDDQLKRRAEQKEMGDLYFDHALKRLHVAQMDVGSEATQCLFFTALYFAFLRRPLQAWEFINAASAKCLLLLSYRPADETSEDQERIRRIFWSCYILESDYLAELSALPPSGIAPIESSIPLPGVLPYATHPNPLQEEHSSLYLLACISMRRLLNRVHNLLYARNATLDRRRFPPIVAELDHQLDEWRDVLPSAFGFTVDTADVETEAGAFLRQRYLTCRSVIYRPYLMWVLSGGGVGDGPSAREVEGCRLCLQACLLHVLNLRGFAHTVLVDTWICSLSMAGAMLVLLAASRIPSVRSVISPSLPTAGAHLSELLRSWQRVLGEPSSPSVDQAVRVIGEADGFIKQVFAAGDILALCGRESG
ncbi:putative C6 transcription factor [Cryphonectria parasitica EP155]|uniref:C6 transcription factor n=1 Tax=Cryphonectria parasitica (strain ATCC 38755 / EP155) TaxID=660469 RepID=A0A9P4Y0K5_CRYP1|nr:putative C6 transcription factor [Cryphonectria parasitica EP155]KAF3764318.1 putative C6 transcription factor [Cryphonectria parasitica EP155]